MTQPRELTGRHAFAIFASFFAVIIAVNLALAWSAVATFPGLEVGNSYVASQTFDARRAAQERLGWTVEADAAGDRLILAITDENGLPVQVAKLDATLGRATSTRDDSTPEFVFDGHAYVARRALGPGNWNIRLNATALEGTPFEQRVVLHVKG